MDMNGADGKPRGRGRPATGETPKRYFRADDDLWAEIARAAGVLGETRSEYIRKVMARDARRILRTRRRQVGAESRGVEPSR